MIELKKKRYSEHSAFNDVVRQDWINAIKLDPDSFDALLYTPSIEQPTPEQSQHYESDAVTEIDPNQDTLTYSDPVLVAVLDCPDETAEYFRSMDSGDNELGEGEAPLLLRVACQSVPKGSVLEWIEDTATGERRVWWYVHSAMNYGSNSVGSLSVCIPCRNFDVNGTPEPKSDVMNG